MLPNGMAWDEGKSVFYLADTGSRTVTAFEADADGPIFSPCKNL